jgi:hypothetical protein
MAKNLTAIDDYIKEKKNEASGISTSNLNVMHENYCINYARAIADSYDVF